MGENAGSVINCSNSATIEATSYHVGGICGYNTGNIQKSYNTANCSSNSTSLAGIAGRSDGIVKFCYNTGSIIGTSYSVGGIAGTTLNGVVSSCYNTGSVSTTGYSENGNSQVGGIVGNMFNVANGGGYTLVTDCYNAGDITGHASGAGGIVGNLHGELKYSYNTGTIIAKSGNTNSYTYAGGIVGTSDGNPSKIQYCYNIGKVSCESGTKYPGGIAGYNISTSTITNCYTLSTAISTTIGNNKGTTSNVASRTLANMQTSDFVTLLGGTTRWQLVTNNYPKLYWE